MAKKSFKENPALQFISDAALDADEERAAISGSPEEVTPGTAPADTEATTPAASPFALKLHKEETRSRRVQLIVKPSLYKRVKSAAKSNRMSVNEYINQILEIATEER